MTFYGRSISVQNQLTSRLGDLYFWIALRYDLSENVTVLRYTLFSHVPAEFEDRVGIGLKDFHYIDKWTVTDHNVAQKADLSWLNEQVVSISQNVKKHVGKLQMPACGHLDIHIITAILSLRMTQAKDMGKKVVCN